MASKGRFKNIRLYARFLRGEDAAWFENEIERLEWQVFRKIAPRFPRATRAKPGPKPLVADDYLKRILEAPVGTLKEALAAELRRRGKRAISDLAIESEERQFRRKLKQAAPEWREISKTARQE